MKEDFSVANKSVAFVDAKEKLAGAAEYLDDIVLPGMLYGKILRSPWPHARIRSIDVTAAGRVTGVKAVITHRDTPGKKFGMEIPDVDVLAVDKVRYAGDEVAAIAAVSEGVAEEALRLIKVEYVPLPVVADTQAALLADAPLVHEDKPGNVARRYHIERGDVEADLKRSDYVFENDFETSLAQPCYMEPMGSIAQWDSRGRLTVWTSIQAVFNARKEIARALGMPESSVIVKVPYIGGGFGGKIMIRNLQPISALLAKKSGKPVKIVLTREEEFLTMRPRVGARIHLKVGVKKDGTLLTKIADIIGDNGAYSWGAPKILLNMSMRTDCLYRWSSAKTDSALVYTNHVPTSGYRGYGNAQMHFALESMVDMICRELKWDPVEIRLKNVVRQGDKTLHGWNLRSCGLAECLEKASEAIKPGLLPREAEGGRIRRGVGVACVIHVSGNRAGDNFDGSSALVRLTEDGGVLIFSGESDMGQGARTAFAQIAAEVLKVPMDSVKVIPFLDTDTSPFCLGSFSSRVTTVGGKAVLLAAEQLREQVLDVGGKVLGVPAGALAIDQGEVFVKEDPTRRVSMTKIATAGLRSRQATGLEAFVCYDPPTEGTDASYYGDYSSAYTFGAHAVEVEVDQETGFVKVLRVAAAHDVGLALNPQAIKGQIIGGISQGIGFALTEDLVLKDGVIQNPSFSGYIVPTIGDMPDVIPIIVETHDPIGPLGAKGVGEPTIIPTTPAIANAIDDAVGVRVRTLPITPEKVFWGIRQRKD